MGLGIGLFLIAVGAVLTWAVNVNTSGVDINTVGIILMVVGALGVALSLIFWSSWGGFHRSDVVDREYVDGPRRRRVIDEY
jgi:hypothetical protein